MEMVSFIIFYVSLMILDVPGGKNGEGSKGWARKCELDKTLITKSVKNLCQHKMC